MARWSRSRPRIVGAGAVVVVGGALLIIPAVSQAGEQPVRRAPRASAPADRITSITGRGGRSAFRFTPGSGDGTAGYSFFSTGGVVQARRLGGNVPAPVQAQTGAKSRPAARLAAAGAATYSTTLTIDSENWTAFNKTLILWNRDTWTYVPVENPSNSLSATADLPPGNYFATAMYGIYQVDSYLLTKAFTVTAAAQTVHLDEKSARETGFTVDDATAHRDVSAVWLAFPTGDFVGFAGGPQTRTYVTTASVPGTTLRVHEVLTKAGTSALKPSPYRYDLVNSWPYPLPASPIKAVTTASLARTTTTIRAQGVTTEAMYQSVPRLGESSGAYLPSMMRAPASFTEYVTPGVTMARIVNYGDGQSLSLADRSLPAGPSPAQVAGDGPLMPGRRFYNDDSRRDGDRLQFTENMTLGDADGNSGADLSTATSMTLSSGGAVLKSVNAVSLVADVPQPQQTYQLDQTTTRRVAYSQLSTKIRSEWTFQSGGPQFGLLPLMDLAVSATGLDSRNRAGSAPVRLTVKPSTRAITATSTVDAIEWSADDGVTWAPLEVTGSQATLTVPATAAFVSLRFTASNDHGGKLRRTVLRALGGPAVPGDEHAGATTISDLKVNDGNPLVAGTSGMLQAIATFTASDPSGVDGVGLYLWHGDAVAPDGVVLGRTDCVPLDTTSSACTAYLYFWDVRYFLANAVAGAWQVAVWATAKDGTGVTQRYRAGELAVKRNTGLSTDAYPEPVVKGKPLTVTGKLTRADWDTWTYRPFASQSAALQLNPRGTTRWTPLKTVTADTTGTFRTTVTATGDGTYRWVYAGDAASNPKTDVGDYIDVQ